MENPFRGEKVNPLEAEIRRIVREEIKKAFQKMAEEARFWVSEDIIESTALLQLENVLDRTINEMIEEKEA